MEALISLGKLLEKISESSGLLMGEWEEGIPLFSDAIAILNLGKLLPKSDPGRK